MTPVNQMVTVTGGLGSMAAVHLMLADRKLTTLSARPEQVIEEIRLRATQVSSILEDILREPHGEPRWGLNE
jgi:hypothetical protein